MYRNILMPLDGSSRAEAILPHVENLAQRYGARVILLYVDTAPALLLERDEVVDLEAYLEKRRQQRQKAETYLRGIIARWQGKGITAVMHLEQGPVVAGIIEAAHKEQADLVAMTSHGAGGGKRAFYGSVTAGVLQLIDRPLLLIRSRFVK